MNFDQMIESNVNDTTRSHFTVNQQNFINNQGNDQQLKQILKDLEEMNQKHYTNESNINSQHEYCKTLNHLIQEQNKRIQEQNKRITLLEENSGQNFRNHGTTPSFQQFEILSSSPAFATRRAVKRQNDLENSLFYSLLDHHFQSGARIVKYSVIKNCVLEAKNQKWYTGSKPSSFFACPSINELQLPYRKTQKQTGGQYCYISIDPL